MWVVKLIDLTNILMIDQQRMNQNQVAEKLSLLFILYTSLYSAIQTL